MQRGRPSQVRQAVPLHGRPRHRRRLRGRDRHPAALHGGHRARRRAASPPPRSPFRRSASRSAPCSRTTSRRTGSRWAPRATSTTRTYVQRVINIVAEIGDPGKTTVYVRQLRPGARRPAQQGPALRGDLHALRAPRLPGPLHPGVAEVRLPLPRRRLRLPGQGGGRPAGAPARPLLHARARAARWSSATASRSTPSSSASRRATRRTTSTGSGSTSTPRGRPHEAPRTAQVPRRRDPAGQRRQAANGNGANGAGATAASPPSPRPRTTRWRAWPRAVGWLDERTGLSPFLRGFLYRKVPKGTNWFYTLGSATMFAFLSQAVTGVFLAMYYEPDSVVARLLLGVPHHQRRLPRRARARHAPVGLDGDDHPDLPPHGPDLLLRRLQVPARAELGDRRGAARADADDGPHGLPAAVRPALLLGHRRGGEPELVRADRSAPTWPTSCAPAPSSAPPRSPASTRCTCWPCPG